MRLQNIQRQCGACQALGPVRGVVYPPTHGRNGVAELSKMMKKIFEHGDANNAIMQSLMYSPNTVQHQSAGP